MGYPEKLKMMILNNTRKLNEMRNSRIIVLKLMLFTLSSCKSCLIIGLNQNVYWGTYKEWRKHIDTVQSFHRWQRIAKMGMGEQYYNIYPEMEMGGGQLVEVRRLPQESREYQAYMRSMNRWENDYRRMWGKDVKYLRNLGEPGYLL